MEFEPETKVNHTIPKFHYDFFAQLNWAARELKSNRTKANTMKRKQSPKSYFLRVWERCNILTCGSPYILRDKKTIPVPSYTSMS